MAYLAIRGSGAVNGVSRLHGEVSRQLFEPLFPRWPEDEVPVGHVTNGVHMPTWDSAAADELWTEACGKERWLGTMETMEEDIRRVSGRPAVATADRPPARRWSSTRAGAWRSNLAASGAPPEAIDSRERIFDPNVLTLGFARRFATYKRPNLLLHDPARLLRLLTERAAAGAAHHRRQGPSGRQGGPGHDSAVDPFHPPAGSRARTWSFSATTTCC